jgi:hypothetical protein
MGGRLEEILLIKNIFFCGVSRVEITEGKIFESIFTNLLFLNISPYF